MVATFDELQSRIFELYSAAAFDEALDLLNHHAHHFPRRSHTLTLYKMCLAARTDQASLAVWMLEESLAAGDWYSDVELRAEHDLRSLLGNQEWERLLSVCAERRTAAERTSFPAVLLAEPSDVAPPWPVLLALHGSAWTGAGFLRHWHSALAAGFLLAVPQSSQPTGPDQFGWSDPSRARAEVAAHVASLATHPRADGSPVVLGGFSAGASLALELAAGGAGARGVVVVAPGTIEDPPSTAAALAERKVKALLVGGRRDLGGSRDLIALDAALRDAGAETALHVFDDLGHSIPASFDELLRDALEWMR